MRHHAEFNMVGALGAVADLPTGTVVTSSFFGDYDYIGDSLVDEMALQGETFFEASGDGGAYSTTSSPNTLNEPREQAVTLVGGTALSMSPADSPSAKWSGEVVWNDANGVSGGGYLLNLQSPTLNAPVPIPWYQAPFINASNRGATTERNVPDVSMVATSLQIYWKGPTSRASGTSAASPLWAGYMALVNEEEQANGSAFVGFANPILYGLASTSAYSTSYFHDITSGSNPTVCQGDAACTVNSYNAVTGYDLATGLGSPNTGMLSALIGSTTWTWNVVNLTNIPSAVTSVAGTPTGNAILAWAIDSTGTTNHDIWYQTSSRAWTQAPGGAVEVAVSPSTGYPWIVNAAGTVFYSSNPGTGMSWTPVTAGATPMSSIAIGATAGWNGSPTAWGISKIASGSDYQIWDYNITSSGWAQSRLGGAGKHIGVDPQFNVWFVNHNGSLFTSQNLEPWLVVQDNLDGGSVVGWLGNITSTVATPSLIGVGPNNEVWMINNQTWHNPSPDDQIFQLDAYNSSGNSAWTLVPGGARSVTVSADGVPWIINTTGTVFSGGGGWPNGNGGALVQKGGSSPASSSASKERDSGLDGGSISSTFVDMDATVRDVEGHRREGGPSEASNE